MYRNNKRIRNKNRQVRSGRNVVLYINEYTTKHSGTGIGLGVDWFEIYNPNDVSININQWSFGNYDEVDGEDIVQINDNIIIPAHGYFVVVADDCDSADWGGNQCPEDGYELGEVHNLYGSIPVEYIRVEFKFGKGCDVNGENCNGEQITIYNDVGDVIDQVDYFSVDDGHPCGADESYARIFDGFGSWECRDANNITIGTSNGVDPAVENLLYINEFSSKDRMFPGLNDSSDWVEVYNPNDYVIDLGGWKISDNNSLDAMPIPGGITIQPFGFLLVMFNDCRDGNDDITGNPIPVPCITQQCVDNVGPPCWDGQYLHVPHKLGGTDSIRIFNPVNELVDLIEWDGHLMSSDNCSYNRIGDGGDWGEELCDSDTSPGYSNELGAPQYSLGDVNMDGTINVVDIMYVVGQILGTTQLNDAQQLLADVDQNGDINIADIVAMVPMIFGVTAQQQSQIMNEIRRYIKPTLNRNQTPIRPGDIVRDMNPD